MLRTLHALALVVLTKALRHNISHAFHKNLELKSQELATQVFLSLSLVPTIITDPGELHILCVPATENHFQTVANASLLGVKSWEGLPLLDYRQSC